MNPRVATLTVNFTFPGASGQRVFNDNNYTYYSFARLDFMATSKIRLYGSWQYNYERGTGTSQQRLQPRGRHAASIGEFRV